MQNDLYAVLGVPSNAGDAEIKAAYRKLAREHHPDARPGDSEAEARFKEISTAYAVLGDPEKRRRYDTFGPDAFRAGGGGGAGNAGDPFGFGDIFEAFFSGDAFGGGGGRQQQAQDLATELLLSLEEVVAGATRMLHARMPVECPTCEASGCRPGTEASLCTECNGNGQVRQVRRSVLGQMVTAAVCPRCGGAGMEIHDPCPDCRGDGRVLDDVEIEIEIPAGIENGQRVRMSGRGPVGPRGGPRGDLYVDIQVAPHERFAREADDLHMTLAVPVTGMVLGATREIETFDEPVEVDIEPGTQPGRVLRLKGRGVPHLHRRRRGDLYIHLTVEIPEQLDEEQEALFRQLAELRGEEVAPPGVGFVSRIKSAFQ